MERDEEANPPETNEPPSAPLPLPKGEPLTLEESVERMYARYGRTFEALAK